MDLIKKNAETLKILGGTALGLVGCCMWISGQFNEVKTRLTKIETILVVKGIMPQGLALVHESKEGNGG